MSISFFIGGKIMKIWAKTRANGEYHSPNISHAVAGFREMGAEIVKYENIIGKVVLTMPKIGALVNLLKNKLFFVSILCLLFGIMYFDNKSKKRRQERKLVREKYEKKSDFYF